MCVPIVHRRVLLSDSQEQEVFLVLDVVVVFAVVAGALKQQWPPLTTAEHQQQV